MLVTSMYMLFLDKKMSYQKILSYELMVRVASILFVAVIVGMTASWRLGTENVFKKFKKIILRV